MKGSLDHGIGSFGTSIETIRRTLDGQCDSLSERRLPVLLSVVEHDQIQLECSGFPYRGMKRFVELMFSDDELDIIHIMGTEPDHNELRSAVIDECGEPTYSSTTVEYFGLHGVSLRTDPYEISFVSHRVRQQYEGYMRSLPSPPSHPQPALDAANP